MISDRAVPLPEAELRPFAPTNRSGILMSRPVRSGVVLVKINGWMHPSAVAVEMGREEESANVLRRRADVEFAELDVIQRRQFTPDDSQLAQQWHHGMIHSFAAWEFGLGKPFVRIAIVDTPFQMNHPDLAAHAVSGWDMTGNQAVTNGVGISHSTMCAGMAAAVINNGVGVAGASNCQLVPINIDGSITQMYQAIVWAADHDIRVVNISWTGGDSDTLNAAGAYLKSKARGILAMPGGNQGQYSVNTNQPNVQCISMTDAADNFSQFSSAGAGIDFAAPGDAIFSTTIGGGYASGTGTSYSTPLFCGVVAGLMSLNPTLSGDEILEILKNTADQRGGFPAGQRNIYYGWGRINYAAAAVSAFGTAPRIFSISASSLPSSVTLTLSYRTNLGHVLLRSSPAAPRNWVPVSGALWSTNAATLSVIDPSPVPGAGLYQVVEQLP